MPSFFLGKKAQNKELYLQHPSQHMPSFFLGKKARNKE
jgi:hypothetical protein